MVKMLDYRESIRHRKGLNHMTTTILITIALSALVLWTMLPVPKHDTTPVRNKPNDDKTR